MPQKVIYNSVLHKTLRTKYTSKLKITKTATKPQKHQTQWEINSPIGYSHFYDSIFISSGKASTDRFLYLNVFSLGRANLFDSN